MAEHRMTVVTQSQFGGPEVLKMSTAELPKALPTEVLIRVKAIGVNPIEAFIRSGAFPMLGAPPFVLGWDISGVVEEVVPGVNRFKVGDEVFGMPLFPRQAGAYASAATPSTTEVLVIETPKQGVTFQQIIAVIPAEIRATVKLYLDGKIRQWYSRGDGKGAVFFVKAKTEEEARAIMETLPLAKEQLMDHQYVPVGPLMPLRMLMGPETQH